MKNLFSGKRWVAAVAAAGVLVLGAAGVTAYAATSSSLHPTVAQTSPTPSTSASPHARMKGSAAANPLAHTDHATFEVKNKSGQWVTYTLDRGNVTAASSTSITLQRPDGQSVTLAINSSTKFRGKAATSAAALKTGNGATVISDNGTATAIVESSAPLGTKH